MIFPLLFGKLSPRFAGYKILVVGTLIAILMVLNLRGVKESVTVLVPIFLLFVITHVILISIAAILTLVLTRGNTSALVLMYSINVFLTFSLSQLGMVRYWGMNRTRFSSWKRHISIHFIGLVLCLSILLINLFEKFTEGGWATVLVTSDLVALCSMIKRHYQGALSHIRKLEEILSELPTSGPGSDRRLEPKEPTAVLLVDRYGGLGIHALLSVFKLFPHHFKNFIFVSVTHIDAANLRGVEEVERAERETQESLRQYVELTRRLGFAAGCRTSVGTEVLVEAEKLCLDVAGDCPRSIVFMGKLIFQREHWYQRLLHNETAVQLQSRLQFAGVNSMVLPVPVFEPVRSSP